MKRPIIAVALIAILAAAVTGCGKPEEQRKLEADLNSEVIALQKEIESDLAGWSEQHAKLDASLKTHQELVAKLPKKTKVHTSDDLAAAKQQLDAAKSEAEAALQGVSSYDKEMDHTQAMTQLTQNRALLTKTKASVEGALNAAAAAVASHEQFKKNLEAKPKAPAKTSAKKTRR